MAKRGGIRQQLSKMTASGSSLEAQVRRLMGQGKYSAAIRKLQQGLKRKPDQTLSITEADIWVAQGKVEFEKARYQQAETAFRSAFALTQNDDTYYWLAKSLIHQQKSEAALEIFQTAFDDKTLPKEMGGCYLKLLMLNGKVGETQALIEASPKRFYAPHLHWARGAIALKAKDFDAASTHFSKMGRIASREDNLNVWKAYAYQCAGEWSQAGMALNMQKTSPLNRLQRGFNKHPALRKLQIVQAAQRAIRPSDILFIESLRSAEQQVARILEFVYLIQEENFHDAAHVLLKRSKDKRSKDKFSEEVQDAYPAIKGIYRPLMLKAAEQAKQEREIGCTAEFLHEALDTGDRFDPNLAINLYHALDDWGDHIEAQQLTTRLVHWVQQAAKENPANWPTDKLNTTLARLYCWQADCQMVTMRYAEATLSLAKADKLAPHHPEVTGRKGLERFSKGKTEAAIPLLTQALDDGCELEEVYMVLVQALEDDPAEKKAIRRRFGKRFKDNTVETDVEIPVWVEALTFQNYGLFENTVRAPKKPSPPVQALQVFVESADDEPSSGQKITLNIDKATPRWEKLLADHPPIEQVEIIKAIYFAVQQHSKRNKKGIAALQSSYMHKISELAAQGIEGADVAHLVVLAVRSPQSEELNTTVQAILNRADQPGNTLALAQRELRRFGPSQAFKHSIENQLKQGPQNPQLLLAQATLYPRQSFQYEASYNKGFEIARRLQDAEALQAFREEDWFVAQERTQHVLGPKIDDLDSLGGLDILNMIQNLAKASFGEEVPPEMLTQMLPELMAGFEEEFEDEDDDMDPFFLPPPPSFGGRRRKSSKKRKSWRDL